MAEFFFNRHTNTENVEPFSDDKYSANDYYYRKALSVTGGCTLAKSNACGTTPYPANGSADEQQTAVNNCYCKYKDNVDKYLAKKSAEQIINGATNDVDEKYNQMVMKNINLGIGLSLMMIYIYTTNY